MDKGTATLEAKNGESIRVEHVEREVKSAGFTPRGVTATAAGIVRTSDQEPVLEWNGLAIRLVVSETPLSVEDGQSVRVTGEFGVQDEDSESVSILNVSEVEPLEP